MKTFKEKGTGISLGQFLFLGCPLTMFLVSPPNPTFTLAP